MTTVTIQRAKNTRLDSQITQIKSLEGSVNFNVVMMFANWNCLSYRLVHACISLLAYRRLQFHVLKNEKYIPLSKVEIKTSRQVILLLDGALTLRFVHSLTTSENLLSSMFYSVLAMVYVLRCLRT